jgi:HEAT repeat protein
MNELLELLKCGDLRSDGHADEVASDVVMNPELFEFLLDGLSEEDDVVRGRTSHALEKVSRKHPELFNNILDLLLRQAQDDKLPVVRWHLAMLLVNLELSTDETEKVISTLYILLKDKSVFVKSWAISGLTILALKNKNKKEDINEEIKFLKDNKSAAIKNRVSKALNVLEDDAPIPKGWAKRNQLI